MEQIERYFKRASKRRSVPGWSLPLELWLLSIRTTAERESNQRDSRPGLGTDHTITDGVYCRKWLHNICCMTRFWGIVP
eukprot:886885-Pyramimonas_sp.AAC.1